MIDLHCHLLYFKDFPQILQQATKAGVKKLLVPSLNLKEAQKLLSLAPSHPSVFVAIGWHPTSLPYANPDFLQKELSKIIEHSKVVALGEIGLDTKKGGNIKEQISLLEAQLELATEYNLPVILHLRGEGTEVILQILKKYPKVFTVWHSAAPARKKLFLEWKERGLAFSFGPNLQRPHNLSHLDLLKNIPNPFFLETDSPFMGKEPKEVVKVYYFVAEKLEINIQILQERIEGYFETYFLRRKGS